MLPCILVNKDFQCCCTVCAT